MPAPTIDPHQRHPDEVVPTDTYRPNDPVWVYRDGTWRAGVIDSASALAATVRYRSNDRRPDADIRTARYVVARHEIDPLVDSSTEI